MVVFQVLSNWYYLNGPIVLVGLSGMMDLTGSITLKFK